MSKKNEEKSNLLSNMKEGVDHLKKKTKDNIEKLSSKTTDFFKDVKRGIDNKVAIMKSKKKNKEFHKKMQDPEYRRQRKTYFMLKEQKKVTQNIDNKIEGTNQHITEVKAIQSETNMGINTLIESQEEIKEDIKDIKSNLIEMYEGISIIKTDLSQLKEENATKLEKILDFEKKLRFFIKHNLEQIYSKEWWDSGIPPNVKNIVNKRLNHQTKEEMSDENKLNMLSFGNYPYIIISDENWKKTFYQYFPNKIDGVKKPLNAIRDIRNALAHGYDEIPDLENLDDYILSFNKKIENS